MTFTASINWANFPDTSTPLNAARITAALAELAAYTDGTHSSNSGTGDPTGVQLIGPYTKTSTTPHTLFYNGLQLVTTVTAANPVTPPVPNPAPSGSAPVFTTGAAILLNNAAALFTTGLETDPSFTDVGVQTGITLQATDKPHAGTKSLKVASGTLAGVYKTKTFSATNARRYSLVWYTWMASTANGSGHFLGGFLDATAANYVSLAVGSTGLTRLLTSSGAVSVTLATFPRDQWVKCELAVTIDTAGTDTVELNINDVSWYSNTLAISTVLMTKLQFGSDFGATTATNIWIDDITLNDPSSGTTDPGVSQPSGVALKSNAFAASGSPNFTGQWVSVSATGVTSLRGVGQSIQPFTYTPVAADELGSMYLDVTATNAYGSATSRSPALAITASGGSPGGSTPPPTTGTFADLLAADRTGSSEGLPLMLNYLDVDWGHAPRAGRFPPPPTWTSGQLWGLADNVGSIQTTSINVASAEIWLKFYSVGWQRVVYETGLLAGAYYDSTFNNANQASGQTAYSGGGTTANRPPAGYNWHFYPQTARPTINAGDVAGVVTIIRARLTPGTFSGSPQIVMCAAGDWWITPTAQWQSDYSQNLDMGIGKFKFLPTSGAIRMFTNSAGDLSTLPPVSYAAAEMY